MSASLEIKKIRLLVVDDHFFVRMGLACSLNAEPDMCVVAEADNGDLAIKLFREHRPDVVILDGRLPGLSGVETLTALRREFPNTRGLMLSIDTDNEDVELALQAGAAGYLSKATQLQELLRAIRAIHAGERHLPDGLRQADALVLLGKVGNLTTNGKPGWRDRLPDSNQV